MQRQRQRRVIRRKQEFVCYRVNLTDNFERADIPGTEFLVQDLEVMDRQPDPLPWGEA